MWFICIVALLIIWITYLVHQWWNPKGKEKLPPGSMGFPIIGETIQFFSPYSKFDIPPFLATRTSRYGPLFRTNLVGQRMIVSTDPEINHYIFQQEDRYFECWYTESFIKSFGEQGLVKHHGVVHKYLKNLILKLTGRENLKENIFNDIDENTMRCLESWNSLGNVNLKEVTGEMILECFAKKLLSYDDRNGLKKLKKNYEAFSKGIISFPINIPGTTYHSCMQGRKNIVKMIKNIFEERKSTQSPCGDFLDVLLEEAKKEGTLLNEEIAIDLAFLLLYASFETNSIAITLAIKFLSEHPLVLEKLTTLCKRPLQALSKQFFLFIDRQKEHEEIARNLNSESSQLTWDAYKYMTFTHMVINETVRLANIAPMILRRVIKDVELKGYTIPAGWLVMVSTLSTHLSSAIHTNPFEFDPWRWQGQDLHAGSRNFMAFGGGVRLCVGADFTKIQMAIFLHHLVTKYRWKVTNRGDIIRRSSWAFRKGLFIQLEPKNEAMHSPIKL